MIYFIDFGIVFWLLFISYPSFMKITNQRYYAWFMLSFFTGIALYALYHEFYLHLMNYSRFVYLICGIYIGLSLHKLHEIRRERIQEVEDKLDYWEKM